MMTNTKTIVRNTGWYGLENIVGFIVTLLTPIMIARTLGPEKNGYIIYVSYIVGVVASLSSFGVPATTRKYMAEYLGMGDRGTARYIYFRTMLLQIGLGTLATAGLLIWVTRSAAGEYKLASALIVLSIWPSMANSISAQTNAAAENMAANMPASVISILVYFCGIAATVTLNWGVVGVGVALLSMRAVDFLVRLIPTMKRVLTWEITHTHPPELGRRMISFAWQAVASMIVALIVWDRSEVILLRNLYPDIRQVSYYSIAFSMAERLLIGAATFSSAVSATIFAQYGRDKTKLPSLAASAFRYLALSSIPLHMIATALSIPALLLLFGHKYEGAAAVVMLAPLLCMSKAFIGPAQSLLECTERQRYVIAATVLAGVVDISVAWSLIPAHGAVGACLGNGAAQATAVVMMWIIAVHFFKIKLPWRQVAKITFISALAALTAYFIAVRAGAVQMRAEWMAPLLAILCGGGAALIVLFGLFYLMRVLEPEDHDRFKLLAGMLPKPIMGPASVCLAILIRPENGRFVRDLDSPQPAFEGQSPVTSEDAPVVLFIAYHFPPSNAIGGARPYRFYKYLKRLGYECHVLTAAAQTAAAADIEYVPDPLGTGVGSVIARQADRVIRRFIWHNSLRLRWSFMAFRAGRRFLKQRKGRKVILFSTSPPVATHLTTLCLAVISGRRWIADFRDPVCPVKVARNSAMSILAFSLERLFLKKAAIALANTDAMLELWHSRHSGFGGKAHILWNGFDAEDEIVNYVLPVRPRKVLSHVGELYGGRNIRPIVGAMMRLAQSGRLPDDGVTILQIGITEEAFLPDNETLQVTQALGILEIRGPVPAGEARAIAIDSDGLLLIQPQSSVQVPAKLFEYLRLERPILAFVARNSASEGILRQAGVPFECLYPDCSEEEMEQRILDFLSMLGRHPAKHNAWYRENFNATQQVKILDGLIRSL